MPDLQGGEEAELEIRHLNAKIDLVLTQQRHRLLEIEQIQTELIEELARKTSTKTQ